MKSIRSAASGIDLHCIRQISIFRDLHEAELHKLEPLLRRKTFAAGATLMMIEQTGESVYFILRGTLKVHVEQSDGTDVIISILGPGEIVGELDALDNAGRSASVVTAEECALLWMDRAAFQHCLQTIPGMAFNVTCALTARLRLANAQIQALAALDTECRVARQILAFAERYGQPQPGGDLLIPIRLTQSDIAGLVGATREHVNKILVSYKERGYLSVDPGHRIKVRDQRALARRCG